jgi:hypothetical protein
MPFTPEAIQAVHEQSNGSPRVINTVCDNALFEAFLERKGTIEADLVNRIGDNLGLKKITALEAPPPPPMPKAAAAVGSVKNASGKIDLAEIDRYLEGLGKLG